jgi:2-polyprenyl-6-methoxyphenol hydroxylase-like FAD-dependent oxidoreductase/predicted DsbA family dithiol-disulfide isomerase
MKVVIIGGGISGITTGILLHKSGFEVCICEKEDGIPSKGNAFLMHSEGLAIVSGLNDNGIKMQLPGNKIDSFMLLRPDDTIVKYQKLEPWQCIKRADLINFLYTFLRSDKIKYKKVFSHFLYEEETAIAAVFQNGEIEYGDVFIGADGSNSIVRSSLFGETNFTATEVKEFVGVTSCQELIQSNTNLFKKYLSKEKPVSFGYIPTSATELVWFMQFGTTLIDQKEGQNDIKEICTNLLQDFPKDVQTILATNDYSTTYIWKTRDFDLLPTFHKKNVVLIGDAAYLALPFTSAGTTNALKDALSITRLLSTIEVPEDAFNAFYAERSKEVSDHTLMGRDLKRKFLNPLEEEDDDIKIPLIEKQLPAYIPKSNYKKVYVLYFTDPICSTCWQLQPHLRKLKFEYGEYIEIEYCMGGLLPSWDNFNRGGITNPAEAAEHWRQVATAEKMPMNPNVWIENPIPSSYPPSIAFKAAQMQNTDKAIIFLRRLNEMLFLESKNIIETDLLYNAAFEAGLDAARLLRDLEGKAQLLFEADLELASKLQISVLPTFIFTDKYNNSKVLKEYQLYESFEQTLLSFNPTAQKKAVKNDIEALFKVFPTLTAKEFSFLADVQNDEAENLLNQLFNRGIIVQQIKNQIGVVWKLNSDLV